MSTEITSKSELQSISGELSEKVKSLSEDFETMKEVLANASDYDGINVTGPAKILSSNIDNILADFEIAAANITGYVDALNYFDVDDFDDITVIETEKNNEQENIAEQEKVVTLEDVSESNKDSGTKGGNTLVNLGYNGGSSSLSSNSSLSSSSSDSSSNSNGIVVNLSNNTSSNSNNNSNGVNNWNPSANVGDSLITTTMIVTPSGKTSSNGRTQRSASEEFTISPGDPDDSNIDISKYKDNEALGFKVTTGNLAYDLCEEDIELLCAIVSAESDKTYDDALAVISTILNRCEASNWINSHGRDPIAQATAPNQYVVYQHGSYEKYMDGNAPETVVQAVKDALAGVRNHKYTSFRSNGSTTYSNNMISPTGNRYL